MIIVSTSSELNSSYIHDETKCKNINHVDKRWHRNFPIERCFDCFGNGPLTTTLKKLLHFTLTLKEKDVLKIQCTHLHSVSKNKRDFVLKLRNYIISLCPLFSFGIVGIMRYNYHQELWVLWGTTTIRNCGYYETQLFVISSKVYFTIKCKEDKKCKCL